MFTACLWIVYDLQKYDMLSTVSFWSYRDASVRCIVCSSGAVADPR